MRRSLALAYLCCLAILTPLQSQVGLQAEELLARAVSLAKANRLEDAQSVLQQGRTSFPNDPRFPVELAGVAWRRTQPNQAKAYLRQGLRLDPSSTYANQFLGTVYLLDGNLFAALKYLNRAGQPRISGVTFSPEPRLRPAIRDRLAAASPGQLLTVPRLSQTERNLERLQLFAEPRFTLTPERDNEYAFSIQAPSLAPSLSGAPGRLLPLLRGLPFQQVHLDWLNLQQRAIRLTSLWRWDPDKRRIAIAYRMPGIQSAYGFWTDLRDEHWDLGEGRGTNPPFGVRSAAVGAQAELELAGGKRWTPSLQVSRHLFDEPRAREPLYSNSTIWELRNRFDLPRWRWAESRVSLDSSVTSRTGRIFSHAPSRLLGAELNALARWLPQPKDDRYQVQWRLQAAALSGNLPIDALYATAMERDNAIWLRGHVGTRQGRKGTAPMGNRFVVSQTEVKRRLLQAPFIRLDAGPFLDLGNVGGSRSGLGSRGFLYDTGAQADITVFGGLRFSVIVGRDLRGGANVFYAAISR